MTGECRWHSPPEACSRLGRRSRQRAQARGRRPRTILDPAMSDVSTLLTSRVVPDASPVVYWPGGARCNSERDGHDQDPSNRRGRHRVPRVGAGRASPNGGRALRSLFERVTGEPAAMWGPSMVGFGSEPHTATLGTNEWFVVG